MYIQTDMDKIENFQDFTKSSNAEDCVLDSLKYLRTEVSELYLPKEIPVIQEIPKPLDFYRNWVAPNIPVLIKGGINNWPALKKWNRDYICEKLENKKISVAVTPNGYADAIAETVVDGKKKEIFVLPEERFMTATEFFDKLDYAFECSDNDKKCDKGIFYIQKQNSNMTEEFSELLLDIDSDLPWASESFQAKPSAINLWIGDQRAVSSLHKDPFENIYCVVSGYKEFILLPPTDRPWLPYKLLSVGQYKETPENFEIINLEFGTWKFKISDSDVLSAGSSIQNKVPWIAVDPENPDYEKYPLYKYASPICVKVEKGDALYLPSLWFHHVKQSHGCIAVNFWYDMNLDIKFAYFQLLENLAKHFENQGKNNKIV